MQMTMLRGPYQHVGRVVLLVAIMILVLGQGVKAAFAEANPQALTNGVTELYNGWAEVEYGTQGDEAKLQKLGPLLGKAEALEGQYPNRAEPLIWSGILLGTKAQAASSGSAVGIAQAAKAKLEKAISIDPKALDGAGYTTLGTLYDKVPGWPIGFGNSSKARSNLQEGVKINPNGMEANYFYASFLYGQGQYREAAQVLNDATQPPTGISKGLGVDGRRKDIENLARQARRKAK